MIYVPKNDYSCYTVLDKDTIRAYHSQPYNPNNNEPIQVPYTDYYINSHYLSREGTQSFSRTTSIPICLDEKELTTDFYYRNDIVDIMIVFCILAYFIIYLPFKLFMKLFRGVK